MIHLNCDSKNFCVFVWFWKCPTWMDIFDWISYFILSWINSILFKESKDCLKPSKWRLSEKKLLYSKFLVIFCQPFHGHPPPSVAQFISIYKQCFSSNEGRMKQTSDCWVINKGHLNITSCLGAEIWLRPSYDTFYL